MRHFLIFAAIFLLSTAAIAQQNTAPAAARPKLVVGIVVDQMRWDYLYRYNDRYGNDGFKRLMREGFNCQNTMISYLPSFTAPGHTCVYTGSVPSIHGIAANDWIDNRTGKGWYCTDDPDVLPVGGSRKAGMMSPRNLLATTVTDELRLATNMRSRVFGISLKDRSSILPAGHLANGAFWFDDSTGNFITSTYYQNTLPAWVTAFNNRHLPDSFLAKGWTLLEPAAKYIHSLPDNNPYEGKFAGETAPVFPHDKLGHDYNTLRKIPAGNELTLMLAEACLSSERLGMQGNTDFLCVSLSSTDYAGHQFAPNALEMEDMYLRLDRQLAGFLRYLDTKIGAGNYLLFLTADHGGAHNSNYLDSLKIPAGNVSENKAMKELNQALLQQLGVGNDSLVRSLDNYQVTLNEKKIAATGANRDKVKSLVVQWLLARPEVAYVADMEHFETAVVPEPIRTMMVNGYNRNRSGCIQIVFQPGWYNGYAPTGTTHGTWNPYDTHIPLLWYGWHVPKGASYGTVYMTDIAATVAALLHIQMPSGCIGKPVTDIAK